MTLQYVDDLEMTIVSSHCNIDKDFESKAGDAVPIVMKNLICLVRASHRADVDAYGILNLLAPAKNYCKNKFWQKIGTPNTIYTMKEILFARERRHYKLF